MQAVRFENRHSLQSIWVLTVKTSGSLCVGKVDHFHMRQHGSVSFGISSLLLGEAVIASVGEYDMIQEPDTHQIAGTLQSRCHPDVAGTRLGIA